jgi:hypothetical protein
MFDVSDPAPKSKDSKAKKQTVESWATAKGMLPEMLASGPAPAGTIPLGSLVNSEFWRFAGARALLRWPEGAEVTEAEFDAAVEQATNGVSR